MDLENVNEQPISLSRNFTNTRIKLAVGLFIGFILGISITFVFGKTYVQRILIDNKKNMEIDSAIDKNAVIEESDDELISRRYINSNTKVYENTRLGYKIDYQRGITQIYDCPDLPCAIIDEFVIHMQPLDFYGKEEILNNDLYCSADGLGGSVHCENAQVSEYTNPSGVKGFLINRLWIMESTELGQGNVVNTKTEQFNDTAYIFPLNGNSKYKAILLFASIPNEKNLEELKNIADSFRLSD